ncbi:hypothetical protein AB0O61_30605 [Streptomyces bungoensis]
MRRRGRDVILLGFEERTASILDNAEAAMAAITKMTDRQLSSAPMVGGFSMGGLVTRYALAKLQHDGFDRPPPIGAYFSYDSPHRGGVVPIGIQAFAHFISSNNDLVRQLDSPASRQDALAALRSGHRQLRRRRRAPHLPGQAPGSG